MVCRLSRRVAQSWRDRHAAIKEDSAPQRQRIMPRGKKPEHELNAFQRAAAHLARPSYNRDAGRILYGEHDVQVSVVVPGVDAGGNFAAEGYELDIVTDQRLVR